MDGRIVIAKLDVPVKSRHEVEKQRLWSKEEGGSIVFITFSKNISRGKLDRAWQSR
jgi:hypothetical protein